MILPDVIVLGCQKSTLTPVLDTLENCFDKEHFKNYPDPITYLYNSRGFRDQEWPESLHKMKDSTWCVGDSFTVGTGTPFEHTWPQLLQNKSGQRTVNVSMEGASNQWICRTALAVAREIAPRQIVVMWSYDARRERSLLGDVDYSWRLLYDNTAQADWPKTLAIKDFWRLPLAARQRLRDNLESNSVTKYNTLANAPERITANMVNPAAFKIDAGLTGVFATHHDAEIARVHEDSIHDPDNFANWQRCMTLISESPVPVLHSFIPDFAPGALADQYLDQVPQTQQRIAYYAHKIDLARDGHHFDRRHGDIITSDMIDAMS